MQEPDEGGAGKGVPGRWNSLCKMTEARRSLAGTPGVAGIAGAGSVRALSGSSGVVLRTAWSQREVFLILSQPLQWVRPFVLSSPLIRKTKIQKEQRTGAESS